MQWRSCSSLHRTEIRRPIGLGGAGQAKTFEATTKPANNTTENADDQGTSQPEMSTSLFGKELTAPVIGLTLAGVRNNINDVMPEEEFYFLLKGAQAFGTIGMVGNISTTPEDLGVATGGNNNGWRIPSVKPQS